MRRGEIEYIPANLLTLVKHCYFKNLLDDEFIEEVQKQFDKLEKLIRLTASNWENEAHVSSRKALQLCEKILEKINEEAHIEPLQKTEEYK